MVPSLGGSGRLFPSWVSWFFRGMEQLRCYQSALTLGVEPSCRVALVNNHRLALELLESSPGPILNSSILLHSSTGMTSRSISGKSGQRSGRTEDGISAQPVSATPSVLRQRSATAVSPGSSTMCTRNRDLVCRVHLWTREREARVTPSLDLAQQAA